MKHVIELDSAGFSTLYIFDVEHRKSGKKAVIRNDKRFERALELLNRQKNKYVVIK